MLKKTMIVKFNRSQKFAETTIIAGRQVYFLTLKNPIYTLKDVIIGSDYGHVPSRFGKWKWTIRTDKRQQVSINPNVLTEENKISPPGNRYHGKNNIQF